MGPVCGGGVHGIHFGGNLFSQLSARFATDHINRRPASDLIEPSGDRIAGQVSEDGLGDLLGELRRTDLAERRGIDQVEVATDEFCECIFRLLSRIFCEQLQVGIAHLHKYIAAIPRNPPRNRQNALRLANRIRPRSV